MFKKEKAHNIHQNFYDYSKVIYKNTDTKVCIICPLHGEFMQTPYHHINRGQGCPVCKGDKIKKAKTYTKQEFVDLANVIHNNKYIYDNADYKSAHIKVIITCPRHGNFTQTPNNHLYNKNGCPSCGYNTSTTANKWLDSLSIPMECREKVIFINGKKYKVDALYNNTIYEYFGYFWHGHPDFFNPEDINPKNKKTYKELYENTLLKIEDFNNSQYDFVYIWGD